LDLPEDADTVRSGDNPASKPCGDRSDRSTPLEDAPAAKHIDRFFNPITSPWENNLPFGASFLPAGRKNLETTEHDTRAILVAGSPKVQCMVVTVSLDFTP